MDNRPNALALEYQADYGRACRDLDVLDLVNNPTANGVCRVLGLLLPEEPHDLPLRDFRALLDDGPDLLLIAQD